MRGLLWKGLAVAALVAAVVVPAASATSATVKVSVLPLPKAALGAAGKPLALQFDSGAISNALAAGTSFTAASAKTFTKMGRITGYGLDYGVGSSGASGVTEIYTQVDQYKTATGAKKGLAFWKKDDPHIAALSQGGFTVTSTPVKVAAVGSRRWANLVSFSDSNIAPLWSLDEQFTEGRYELKVTVWASESTAATALAPALAKKLDTRLRQALAGHLHAKPVPLPKLGPAGPPAGGPNLAALALQPSDFTGTTTVKQQGYVREAPPVLSAYNTYMQPAGPFGLFDQEVFWYATANEAAFNADLYLAEDLAGGASQLDLSTVGDGARGAMQNGSNGGFGTVYFSSGQLLETLVGVSQTTVQASDVQKAAQAAAHYINAAGLGS